MGHPSAGTHLGRRQSTEEAEGENAEANRLTGRYLQEHSRRLTARYARCAGAAFDLWPNPTTMLLRDPTGSHFCAAAGTASKASPDLRRREQSSPRVPALSPSCKRTKRRR